MDTAIKIGIGAAKIASKRVVQITGEATGDLIGKKIADTITSLGKTKSKEKEKQKQKICIPLEENQKIIDDLRCDFSDVYIVLKGEVTVTGVY